ncbi:MAG: GSCFA domain-containing protein [Rhodocyclales bacterium]|nr:GSCFA domain-containing protein [Rhodocyclales bacterium]
MELEQEFAGVQVGGVDFLPLYRACIEASQTPVPNWKVLLRAQRARHLADCFVASLALPGKRCECGVLRGFSALLMARLAAQRGVDPGLILIDSFEGLSAPTGEDAIEETAADGRVVKRQTHQAGHFATPIEYVRQVLRDFPDIAILKGWVPEVFAQLPDERYAFVHLDLDLYEPIKAGLEYFYPRMVPGGILVNDDYGSTLFPGAGKAWREFFAERGLDYQVLDSGQAVYVCPAQQAPAVDVAGKDDDALIEEAVAAMARGDLGSVELLLKTVLGRSSESDAQHIDAAYLLGALAIVVGAEAKGIDVVSACVKQGGFSPKFSYYFGRFVDALGERGEALRKQLQLGRLIPWHVVGFLGIEQNFNNIEPWYFSRAMVNVFPRKQGEFADPEKLVEKYVLPGWLPAAPPFDAQSRLLTLGSCFAQELRNYLSERGMASDWLFVPPGLNNTFALRNFISWCLTGETSTQAYWYDENPDGGAVKWEDGGNRASYEAALQRVDGIILTVGLAEVWYDTATGGVFWRGVPKSLYDETRHLCRVSTVAENEENLREIIRLIHAARPGLPIVVTLSPVPLKATSSPRSCISVDTVSKSILRVAIDNVVGAGIDNVYYWPSFEIVRSLGPHLPYEMFGEDGNTRHVNRQAVHLILKAFIKHYFRSQV